MLDVGRLPFTDFKLKREGGLKRIIINGYILEILFFFLMLRQGYKLFFFKKTKEPGHNNPKIRPVFFLISIALSLFHQDTLSVHFSCLLLDYCRIQGYYK